MKIASARRIRGTVRLPGDKSISHRAALIAAVADGTTRITGYSTSADCEATLNCLSALGVPIERDGSSASVAGCGRSGLRQPSEPLNCGNSGTTMRLLAGILAGQPFDSELIGDGSLSRRPMSRIIEPLEKMGARVKSASGHAPITIRGRAPLDAVTYRLPIASAQVKSCVLLAGLFADGRTTVVESVTTRDHTERLLKWFRGDIETKGNEISVSGERRLKGRDIIVPEDISAAAFLMVAAACLEGSEIDLPGVGLNPNRTAIVGVLEEAGIEIKITDRVDLSNEPAGRIEVRRGSLAQRPRLIITGRRTAALIDELPIIAVLGTQLPGGLEVRDAQELRVKESDRIAAVCDNLQRMGASVTMFDDGFSVERSRLIGASVEAFGDHRIAMAMAVAGLIAEGETDLSGAECVDVSFPGFFDALHSVVI